VKLIIAEKPSVAIDTAKAISPKFQKKDGYIEAGEYTITWAVGHLLEIDDTIAPKEWKLETLPILPEKFEYKVSKGKNKQFNIVKSLVKKADEIFVNTDAGREGELIARLILLYSGWNGWDKTYRFWTSEALTKNVILRELKARKPAKNWDSLFYSGLARQQSDWLVGINLTRALTVIVGDGSVWSIGRVQTPVLKLIVERDLEIKNFKPKPYWQLEAVFEKDSQKFKAKLLNEKDTIFEDKNKIWEIFKALKDKDKAVVKEIEKKQHKKYAPPLFSITTLQMTANKRFGFTAQKTLMLAQDLYEAKYISYPRTEAQHLDENPSTKDLVKNILKKLGEEQLIENVDKVGKRVFDSSKLTDHYAIIPMNLLTEEKAKKEGLNQDHLKIYELIKNRFLAVFMPPYEYETTKAILDIDGYQFTASGKVELSLGWKAIDREDEDDKIEAPLPQLEKGDMVHKISQRVIEDKTKPPAHYTESTLLNKMKQLELGTGATRAGIIQTLKDRFYIKNKGKSLIATEKGFALIEKIKDKEFASPKMTSKWEQQLEQIYTQKLGKKGYEDFLNQIKEFTKKEVEAVKGISIQMEQKPVGRCRCGGDVFEYGKYYQCGSCNLKVWKEVFSKKLKEKEALLLYQGTTVYVEGLKGKSGKKFGAGLKLTDEGKIELVFDESQIDTLAKCKCDGVIVEADKSYYCKSCKAVVWKEISGKKISKNIALKLFKGEKVKVKGFKSKAGKNFEAILCLENGKPKMEFPENEPIGKCSCGGEIFEYSNRYVCKSCNQVVWKEFFGKKLSKREAVGLLNGRTIPISNLKSKSGRKFDANVALVDGKVKIVSFENG